MDINIKLADESDFFTIKNFIPLFRHYIGEVYDELPNKYGIFTYDITSFKCGIKIIMCI